MYVNVLLPDILVRMYFIEIHPFAMLPACRVTPAIQPTAPIA
jgi:hypothetical protein